MTKIGNKNNADKCKRYKIVGMREINKARKALKRLRKLAKRKGECYD